MTTKAKRRAKIAEASQPDTISDAICLLRSARILLRLCGCKNAADYLARAMKSTEGALRHADRMARTAQPTRTSCN